MRQNIIVVKKISECGKRLKMFLKKKLINKRNINGKENIISKNVIF